jgi:hypothetical protein
MARPIERCFGRMSYMVDHIVRSGSVLEIPKSGFNQFLNDGEDHRRGDAEEQHPVRGFERPQQSPPRTHNNVAVAQRREVDGRVVVGAAKLVELSAQDEQDGPPCELEKVSYSRISDCARHNGRVDPEARTYPATTLLATNKADGGPQGECMNEGGANEADYAQ